MFRPMLTAPALCLLLAPALLRADDAPKVQDKDLEGDWQLKSITHDGKEEPPGADEANDTLTFHGDSAVHKGKDATHKATFTVDASKTPKTIDMTAEDGPDKGKVARGVYEVKDDELRICVAQPGKDRPTELSAKEGAGFVLVVLKRAKK
jgi:uncharacterized protein (TIGR03067 family)